MGKEIVQEPGQLGTLLTKHQADTVRGYDDFKKTVMSGMNGSMTERVKVYNKDTKRWKTVDQPIGAETRLKFTKLFKEAYIDKNLPDLKPDPRKSDSEEMAKVFTTAIKEIGKAHSQRVAAERPPINITPKEES